MRLNDTAAALDQRRVGSDRPDARERSVKHKPVQEIVTIGSAMAAAFAKLKK
jgi:hypothetical protein